MEYGGRSGSMFGTKSGFLGIGQNWPTHRVGAGGDIFPRSEHHVSNGGFPFPPLTSAPTFSILYSTAAAEKERKDSEAIVE